ncbi:MAG: hypothetical protein IID35_03085, partial [Planctomycetes bacterium]|nr:hypothetical protein [Planctomycetota bacterium]
MDAPIEWRATQDLYEAIFVSSFEEIMTPQAAKALQCETDFLAGVDGNFEAAKGKDLRGSSWKRSTHD